MTTPFTTPFRMGDRVRYIGKKRIGTKTGTTMIVTKTELRFGCPSGLAYATTEGAWFGHFDLELVEACSEQTMTDLWASLVANDIYEELCEETGKEPSEEECLAIAKQRDPWTNERAEDDSEDRD